MENIILFIYQIANVLFPLSIVFFIVGLIYELFKRNNTASKQAIYKHSK